jgi:hypothetical protein
MIAPVNVPPSQLQIIQGSSLDKSTSSAPDLNTTPSLKKKAQPVLQIAQVSTTLNQAVLSAEPQATSQDFGAEAEKTQFPKARILPSPLVSPKELPKAGEPKSGQLDPNLQPLTPDVQPQNSDQLLPNSQPPEAKPESKKQQKPEAKPLVPDAQPQNPDLLSPNSQPSETKPESKEQQKPEAKPLVPDVQPQNPDLVFPNSQPSETKPDSKEQQKPEAKPLVPDVQERLIPEQKMPETQPQENPEEKQNSKPDSPPLPSEVFPAPSQQQNQNPLPSGVPPTEPGNYPNNTGPGAVYYNQNYIAPSVSFGKDTLIGATSRFGIGKNLSVRPSLFLGNTARIAVPLTYDFGFNENEQFEKNPLVVFHAGGGLDYSSKSGANTSTINPLVVFGADVYLGDGASVLLQIGNTFNSDFVAVAGVGLQF